MHRLNVMLAILCLAATPASAASPKVEKAIASLGKLEANAANLAAFCRIDAEFVQAGEDQTKIEAADRKMEAFLKSLGAEYTAAWALSNELEPESEDGKALSAAFERLEGKCAK